MKKLNQETKPQTRQIDMMQGSILKGMLAFCLPLLAGTFFQMLYNTVDALIVGRFVGAAALSAVGGAPAVIYGILVGLFVGLASGGSVVCSQAYGAGNKRVLHDVVHTGMAFAIVSGIVLMIVTMVLADPLLRLMNTPADAFSDSVLYLRIMGIGMTASMIYNMGAGFFRAVGDSRRPFYFLVTGTIVNIILDVLLVAVLRMGVAGAALGTILAQAVSGFLIIRSMVRVEGDHRLILSKMKIHRAMMAQILRIGLPSAVQSMMYSLSNALLQAYVNGFGITVVAAWVITGKIDAIFWMVVNSLGVTVMTFTGQNYGAGKMKRVFRGMRQMLVVCAVFSILFGLFLQFCSPEVVPLFSADAAVVSQGIVIERFFAKVYILYISIEVISGVLRGMGDAFVPTLITIFGVCALRIIWVIVMMPRYHSIITVSMGYPVTWGISSAAFVIYFLLKRKKILERMRAEGITE